MAKNSIILFFQGRLFQDFGSALRQALIGIVITAVLFVALFEFAELPVWLNAGIAGFAGGLLQPYLFKNLKYA